MTPTGTLVLLAQLFLLGMMLAAGFETASQLSALILAGQGMLRYWAAPLLCERSKADIRMAPTKLLIFGSPKAGTPLMLAAPSAAIDLPLKILVWEDTAGTVFMSYNTPEYLRMRHGFPANLLSNIGVVEALVGEVALCRSELRPAHAGRDHLLRLG